MGNQRKCGMTEAAAEDGVKRLLNPVTHKT